MTLLFLEVPRTLQAKSLDRLLPVAPNLLLASHLHLPRSAGTSNPWRTRNSFFAWNQNMLVAEKTLAGRTQETSLSSQTVISFHEWAPPSMKSLSPQPRVLLNLNYEYDAIKMTCSLYKFYCMIPLLKIFQWLHSLCIKPSSLWWAHKALAVGEGVRCSVPSSLLVFVLFCACVCVRTHTHTHTHTTLPSV